MDETVTLEQSQQAASLMVDLTRRLFLPDDDQVAELPVAQLRVCGILCGHGGPRAMSVLSRELGVSLSALTQIADRLERARLVRRVAEGSDRRVRCLQLTERGEQTMRQREETRVGRMMAALEHLSPRARQDVLAALQTLADAWAAASEQGVCAAADK
jgi:DNA-binding MarR family transcriptional regulator